MAIKQGVLMQGDWQDSMPIRGTYVITNPFVAGSDVFFDSAAPQEHAGLSIGSQIEVTPEMIVVAEVKAPFLKGAHTWIEDIYRAMHAVAPVELTSEVERKMAHFTAGIEAQNVALLRDRASLYTELIRLRDALKARTDERDKMFALKEAYRQALAAKDARIAELDTLLAQRPAPVSAKPTHDWTRPREDDRRRIGAFW